MSTVTILEFNGHRIRTVRDIDGRTWWGLKDLVQALELTETPTRWYWWLEDFEKDNKSYLTPKGRQYMRVVSRAGINKMLENSPVAEDFSAWAREKLDKKEAAAAKTDEPAERLYTPTRIGHALGGVSAQRVNRLLCNLGMQTPVMDFNRKRYLLTDVGRVLGVELPVRKKNNEEASSVMWKKAVISLVAARLRAEQRTA